MKIKLFIPIVFVILLSASTLVLAAKPSDLPDQAYGKGHSEDSKWLRYEHFVELYTRLYDKFGEEPQAIARILSNLGR